MEDSILKIMKEFNLKTNSMRKLKYMYICNTDKGVKILKPTSNTENSILLIHRLKQHLSFNNFSVDNYYISNQGTPFYTDGVNTYTLTDFKNYQEADFSDANQIKHICSIMGNFHKIGQNFEKNVVTTQKPNILLKFNDDIKKLESYKKSCHKQKVFLDFDIAFLKNYEFFYSKCQEAIDILKHVDCENLNKLALQNTSPSHNNFKEENVLVSNNIHLCNFEGLTIDHHVHDLTSVILRHLRKERGYLADLNELLDAYSRNNPLSNDDVKVVSAILKFPSRYINICSDFYNRKRKFTPNIISSRFFNILEKKDIHYSYIDSLKI